MTATESTESTEVKVTDVGVSLARVKPFQVRWLRQRVCLMLA